MNNNEINNEMTNVVNEISENKHNNNEIITENNNIKSELTQEEKDILNIKNNISFLKPLDGQITSKYGMREPTTKGVPKNHTGVDIASVIGTKIKSATDGEVTLVSSEGDYGKHVRISNGDVSIIYAHCNNIYVKEGDKILQGQEIAEVRLYR